MNHEVKTFIVKHNLTQSAKEIKKEISSLFEDFSTLSELEKTALLGMATDSQHLIESIEKYKSLFC